LLAIIKLFICKAFYIKLPY